MFTANAVRIFIASPVDVQRERVVVREAMRHWNAVHAPNRKVILLPVGWETHAAPDSRNPAQDLIDKKLIDHCDVLIGLFHARIGTRAKDAVPATVHEIERFRQAGKRASIYFCTRNVPRALADGARLVDRLQKKLHSMNDAGLTDTYGTPESLKSKLDLLFNEVADEYTPSKDATS
ncbi:DUF4062 domain-containing protein [Streptomyces hokutonensis]|uniref:DUF4062 domain-containing protein n=1 Tax=Streptomyces hokutonensis TaxID=1306990 RepID=A0ABW6M756_9ACTN